VALKYEHTYLFYEAAVWISVHSRSLVAGHFLTSYLLFNIILLESFSYKVLFSLATMFNGCNIQTRGPDSSVGIATDYGLDGPGSNPGENKISVQTGPEAHPASCKMGTGSFPGVRAAGACC